MRKVRVIKNAKLLLVEGIEDEVWRPIYKALLKIEGAQYITDVYAVDAVIPPRRNLESTSV
jgi:hypothetical protein